MAQLRLILCFLLAPLVAEETRPQLSPGKLVVEPLLVAPRTAPGCQLVRLRFDGAGPTAPCSIEVHVPGKPVSKSKLSAKATEAARLTGITVPVAGIQGEETVTVKAFGEDWEKEATVVLRPLRPWTLFLVQHTHTDIGYTDLPSRVNVDHLTFLDEALRACRLTDDYPDAARFRWTCEATWAVERYLAERPPDRVREFLRRVRQGRIEVSAMRLNMTDLATEEAVVRNLLPVKRLRARGIPITSAMQCDVNGYPWALPELLEEIGVRGLAGGINKTRSTLPYEFPRAIEWQSPSTGSVLAWRGEHYMFANFMGFRESVDKILAVLPGYLAGLEKKGYPYRIALLQMAGYFTDNAAPCHRASDLVREWNERFAAPMVRLATLSEWFEALRGEPPAPPTRKAWPDWWADGVGSAPLEAGVIREAQEKLLFAETFLSLARAFIPGLPDRRPTTREAYLFACLYDEHTFGAAESVSRPFTINTKTQWKEKSSHAYRASWLATELEEAALTAWARDAVPRGKAGVVVFNSLPFDRTGPVTMELPRGIVEEGTAFRIVDPESGDEVPYQHVSSARNYRTFEMIAQCVPAVGYRVYLIEPGTQPAEILDPFRVAADMISNGVTAVRFDTRRAGITAIQTPPNGRNLIDTTHEYAFNQYVHESIVHEKGRWHLWPPQPYTSESFRRLGARGGQVKDGARGPVRRSARLLSSVSAPCGEVEIETEVSLYRGLPWVFLKNRVRRPETFDAVAGYFSFPFAASQPPRADVVGGVMVPGKEQIPGSAADWHALQRWVRVAAAAGGAAWVTVDAPLVQFGGFNTGKWTQGLTLENPCVHSWVMNNYWFTNFVASQRGDFVFRYAVAGGKAGTSDVEAHRFARRVCSPLRARVTEGSGRRASRASFLQVEPSQLDLVGVKEAEDISRALVLRVRNRSGKAVKARITFSSFGKPRSVVKASILEEPRGDLPLEGDAVTLEMAPWRLQTFVVRF